MKKNIILLTVLTAFFTGCVSEPIPLNSGTSHRRSRATVKKTSADTQKQQLLKRIDYRFSDPKAHYDLGQLYRQRAQWNKAQQQYDIALQLNPGHKPTQAAKVKMYMEQPNTSKANVLADIYINQASISAEALLYLGRAFQNEGLNDYAYRCFNKALMLAPNSAALNRQLGYYYKRKGDLVRAEESFKRCIQLDPYDSEVAGELGRMGVIVEVPRKRSSSKNVDKLDRKLSRKRTRTQQQK